MLSGKSASGRYPYVNYRVQPTAQVDETAEIGAGSSVWELAQIREGAKLGEGCVVGRGAYVGTGVRIGNNVKLQNYALVYEPAELGDGVFVGPAVVLTNDHNPRSVDPTASEGGGTEASEVARLGASARRALAEAPRSARSSGGQVVAPGDGGIRPGPRVGRHLPVPDDRRT
ncbi:Acetylglucosamine-1-phosphate uridylyltransferase OS=Streptomyces microflavus OX=1919 GN=Smic_23900 PE=4 SV=1 [Streptomyces microflavus]